MNPPRSAGDGRQEIQLTAMVPIELPVLSNLACRLLVEVLVRAAGVKELSVPVPVPGRSAPAVVPHAEVEHEAHRPEQRACSPGEACHASHPSDNPAGTEQYPFALFRFRFCGAGFSEDASSFGGALYLKYRVLFYRDHRPSAGFFAGHRQHFWADS